MKEFRVESVIIKYNPSSLSNHLIIASLKCFGHDQLNNGVYLSEF